MNPKAGKITVVVYPSWTREVASSNLAFQTIGSISIEVSAFGFLPNDKGSIPLWNTNDFVAQWQSTGLLNRKLKVQVFPESQVTNC